MAFLRGLFHVFEYIDGAQIWLNKLNKQTEVLSLWKLNKFMTAAVFVSPLVNIHTHRLNSEEAIQIMSADALHSTVLEATDYTKNTLYSFGLHPLFMHENTRFDKHYFEELLSRYPVAAIGEAGLDNQSTVSTEFQLRVFREQTEFAATHQLPVIIHCTGRWNELELLFKERKITDPPWIIHGFRKTKLAEKFMHLGAYFGIGAALLYDERLQTCVQALPLERIFLETDDADVDIKELYQKLASVKSLPLQAITEQLYTNYKVTFHHDKLA